MEKVSKYHQNHWLNKLRVKQKMQPVIPSLKQMDISKPKDAIISEDELYRYGLSRNWDTQKGRILFIMLNPSTADQQDDDPTIKRVEEIARLQKQCGGMYVGNLYALRTPHPNKLRQANQPVGPDNINYVKDLISKSTKVVFAWGQNHQIPQWLESVTNPYCVSISKNGNPQHPLKRFQPKTLQLKPYDKKSSINPVSKSKFLRKIKKRQKSKK